MKKFRSLGKQVDLSKEEQLEFLQTLAYSMTNQNVVQTECELFEQQLFNRMEEYKKDEKEDHFRSLLAYFVNSGLLRCSNDMAALDPTSDLDRLHQFKISFFHQSFQEYLTALYVLEKHTPLPSDVSHDAFWREIPIYCLQRIDDAEHQKNYVLNFLYQSRPDYLTVARLLGEIQDRVIYRKLENVILDKLIRNIAEESLYHYIIETFLYLGEKGIGTLRDCLDKNDFPTVFAKPEAHILKKAVEEGNEQKWCKLGRPIYILGELGDFWLVQHLSGSIHDICSRHLLYHIGEACLTLARRTDRNADELRQIGTASQELFEHKNGDPISQGYALLSMQTCQQNAMVDADSLNRELKEYLEEHINLKDEIFKLEFWIRAHGIEVFSEIAQANECANLLKDFFEKEEKTEIAGYFHFKEVQSSIIKAAIRSLNKYTDEKHCFEELLVVIFASSTIESNPFALGHLERLLSQHFRKPDDLIWLDERKYDTGVSKKVKQVIDNILWLYR